MAPIRWGHALISGNGDAIPKYAADFGIAMPTYLRGGGFELIARGQRTGVRLRAGSRADVEGIRRPRACVPARQRGLVAESAPARREQTHGERWPPRHRAREPSFELARGRAWPPSGATACFAGASALSGGGFRLPRPPSAGLGGRRSSLPIEFADPRVLEGSVSISRSHVRAGRAVQRPRVDRRMPAGSSR